MGQTPEYRELMTPILSILSKHGEALDNAQIATRLTEKLRIEISDDAADKNALLVNRLEWALTYLMRSEQIARNDDGFVITDNGQKTLRRQKVKYPTAKVEKLVGLNEERTQIIGFDGLVVEDDDDILQNHMASCYQQFYDRLKNDVLELVHSRSPDFFENLIIDLLLAMGYGGQRRELAMRLGRSGDGGVDGRVEQDILGLDVVYIQAKRYQQGFAVPVAAVRDFAGSLDAQKSAKGVLVTTSHFTNAAREFVTASSRRIALIDGDMLAGLMIQHDIGVRLRESFVLKSIDIDYFGASGLVDRQG